VPPSALAVIRGSWVLRWVVGATAGRGSIGQSLCYSDRGSDWGYKTTNEESVFLFLRHSWSGELQAYVIDYPLSGSSNLTPSAFSDPRALSAQHREYT